MSEWLERIQIYVAELSPRERLLLLVVAAMMALLILVFGIVSPVLNAASSATRGAESAEQELSAVVRLRQEYDEIAGRLSQVEARIAQGRPGNLFTTLENLARQSAVKVDSMEPQPSPASDRYTETKVQVVLKGVTLAQLVNYLHQLEASEQLLSVKSLRVRTRSDKPEMLDATFTVSSFERI